jgi:RNA polymerase sigma-70 factor (ECF subfamily)
VVSNRAETPVESLPDRQGPLSAAAATELRDEARTEVMAWHIDGFGSAEIAATLHIDPAAVRQNLIKARRSLKKKLGISGAPQ